MTGTMHKYLSTFIIIPRSVLLRIRNVAHNVVEDLKTYFCQRTFFLSENRAFYELILRNVVVLARTHMTM